VVNHKRVYRLYRLLGLTVRVKRRKRLVASPRVAPRPPTRPGQRWSMDFVCDHTAEGFRFRILTLVDDFSRRSPGLLVERSIGGGRVVRFLEELARVNGYPETIVIDNGPEFVSNALDWTDFDADDQSTIALSMITSHGRATPLLWKTVMKSELKGWRNEHGDVLLERFRQVLPAGVKVTVLADRGFGDQALYELLKDQLGLDFVVRFRRHHPGHQCRWRDQARQGLGAKERPPAAPARRQGHQGRP
jgi:hypothetical protein